MRRWIGVILLFLGCLLVTIIVVAASFTLAQPTAKIGSSSGMVTCAQGTGCDATMTIWMNPDFVATVKVQIAQGLRLSAVQITADIQAGEHINTLATQQGLSRDQWQTLEIQAMQTGLDALVNANKQTTASANTILHYWTAHVNDMDANVEFVFHGCQAGKTGCIIGTPIQ